MKKLIHIVRFTTMIILFTGFMASVCLATIYYVDARNGKDNNDGRTAGTAWRTVEKVNTMSFNPGDQILFSKGETWREQLNIQSSGSPEKPILFGTYGDGNKPIIKGTNDNYEIQRDYCIYSDDQADYIIIDGFELGWCNDSGIFTSENDGWTIRNCTIHDCGQRGIFARGKPSGDGEGSAKGLIIEDNNIGIINCSNNNSFNLEYAGLLIRGMEAPIIRRNYIATVNIHAIVFNKGGGRGLGALSSEAEIYENEITNCLSGMSILWTTYCQIYRNYIHHTQGFGIATPYGSDYAEIYYNVIHDLTLSPDGKLFNGIDINCNSQNGKVYNNVVWKVAYCSFTIETADGACNGWVIKNNIFDARENEPGDVPIQVYDEITDITISNNNYICNQRVGFFQDKVGRWKGEYMTLDEWNSLRIDSHSISADPEYVSLETRDFRLQSSSPCIDAGIDVELGQDFDGNPVFYGQGVDMGAFEYHKIYPPRNVRVQRP